MFTGQLVRMVISSSNVMLQSSPSGSLFRLLDGQRWFVIQTLYHRENLAALHLGAQGFGAFLPRLRKTVRHARRMRDVLAPVFPGYMFVILDPSRAAWRSVNGTFGVARLITAADRPLPVPTGVVEGLIASLDASGLVRLDGGLEVGQRVRVVAGPFAQILGTLDRLDGRGRARVLLEIMGGGAPVAMDRSNLAVV